MGMSTRVLVLLLCALPSFAEWDLDESPPAAREWGYRPDGIAVAVNPPGFSWRPCGDAATYLIQVAGDVDFTKLTYTCEGIPWSAHCPPKPFPEGSHYWRYAARNEAGEQSGWSKVRSFTVGGDAVVSPKPTRGELEERMPKEHPRLFFRPEDLPRLRELAEGPLEGQWRALVDGADKLLETPPDTSEPPEYPKDVDRRKTPDEWRKIWWGNRRRVIAVADAAAKLGFVYRLSGDEKYGQGARELLVAMTKWDPKGATSYRYNDEAAMPALYMTSRAYTWACPILSEEDRAAVAAMMRERGDQAFERLRKTRQLWMPYDSHNNRAWHFLGELAIAFYDQIPEAPTWLDYAMTIFYTAYPVWGDSDGGWHEGSAYWVSYTSRFMYWAYVVRAAFDINVFERPFFRRVGYYGMHLFPPGTRTGGFGDQTISMSSSRIASLMAILANGARNPHWKWYADTCGASFGGSYLGFIYAASAMDLEAAPPTELPSSACFHGVGIAVLNTNLCDAAENVQIHFKSSPFGRQSHGYNSNNAFLLTLGGQRAFIRSGKRDLYGSPHHRKWMWETKSDNAITVNGIGQMTHLASASGRIVAFETSPNVDVVAGEAAESYKDLERWTRRIMFFKPHAVLINDVLDAPEPSTFEWRLHAMGPFVIDGQNVVWEGEPGKVRVQFLEPDGLVLSQTDQYDPPPGDYAKINWSEWHLTAQAAEKAKHREFLTLLTINDAQVGVEHTAARKTCNVTLTLPEDKATIRLSQDGFEVRAAGFERAFSDAPSSSE